MIANAIIYYNSAILSRLLTKYEASGNAKALALIKKISPAAWRHIHLNGHYTFHGDGQVIDLDAIVAGLELVKNAQRSKTVKVLSRGYANESSGASIKARFQKSGSS